MKIKEIWIVQGSSGQYDEYWTWTHRAFESKEAAQSWIEKQSEVDYQGLEELEVLASEYCASLPTDGIETEEQWELFYKEEEKMVQKAKEEIQAKYPDADLTLGYDFNGYRVLDFPVVLETKE